MRTQEEVKKSEWNDIQRSESQLSEMTPTSPSIEIKKKKAKNRNKNRASGQKNPNTTTN